MADLWTRCGTYCCEKQLLRHSLDSSSQVVLTSLISQINVQIKITYNNHSVHFNCFWYIYFCFFPIEEETQMVPIEISSGEMKIEYTDRVEARFWSATGKGLRRFWILEKAWETQCPIQAPLSYDVIQQIVVSFVSIAETLVEDTIDVILLIGVDCHSIFNKYLSFLQPETSSHIKGWRNTSANPAKL